MNKRAIKKWSKTMVEEDTKALAEIKVMLDNLYEKGYELGYEIEELILDIESVAENVPLKIANHNPHLKFITNEIANAFEFLGRNRFRNLSGNELTILLKTLKQYVDTINIPADYLAVAKLKFSEEK